MLTPARGRPALPSRAHRAPGRPRRPPRWQDSRCAAASSRLCRDFLSSACGRLRSAKPAMLRPRRGPSPGPAALHGGGPAPPARGILGAVVPQRRPRRVPHHGLWRPGKGCGVIAQVSGLQEIPRGVARALRDSPRGRGSPALPQPQRCRAGPAGCRQVERSPCSCGLFGPC